MNNSKNSPNSESPTFEFPRRSWKRRK